MVPIPSPDPGPANKQQQQQRLQSFLFKHRAAADTSIQLSTTVCPPACEGTCLTTSLPACSYVCLTTCLQARSRLSTFLACLPTHTYTYTHLSLLTYLPTYLLTVVDDGDEPARPGAQIRISSVSPAAYKESISFRPRYAYSRACSLRSRSALPTRRERLETHENARGSRDETACSARVAERFCRS